MFRTRPVRRACPQLQHFSTRVFRNLARATRYMEPSLAERWTQIVGPEIAAMCWPGRLSPGARDRSLEIFTRNGASATRLSMSSEDILRAINRVLGPSSVTRLAIKQTGSQVGRLPVEEKSNSHPLNTSTCAQDISPLDAVLARYRQSLKPDSDD